MTANLTPETLSRIDKLLLDSAGVTLEEARRRRAQRAIGIAVGADISGAYGLQVALITAVNLAARSFGAPSIVYMPASLADAPNLVPMAGGATLGAALFALGARLEHAQRPPSGKPFLLLGDAAPSELALRVTFDGWLLGVGPVAELPRMAERDWCPVAGVGAAALAVGEVFADFAALSVTATRQVLTYSLWRPDAALDDASRIGVPIEELPSSLAMFGLGHLGQAYAWAYAALKHASPEKGVVWLCDDDHIELPNLETGAVAERQWIDNLKTRMVARWLEVRGYKTRLMERRVDKHFRRTASEPVAALSGFDDNEARQWLSAAGYDAIFDTGLGGEAFNFDAITFRAWPNPRPAHELWPLETEDEKRARAARRERLIREAGYDALTDDECGRTLLAGQSVAVPFIGAFSSCIAFAELLKATNGGPVFSDIKLRLCSLAVAKVYANLAAARAAPLRGLRVQKRLGTQVP
jgi:hypothetical protein